MNVALQELPVSHAVEAHQKCFSEQELRELPE